MIEDPNFSNPLDFRKLNQKSLLSSLQAYHQHMRQRYLIGLIHPDLAVKHYLAPKLYHDVPIPTSTIGLYGQSIGTTNVSGNALISFRAPGQPGTSNNMQNITINNAVGLSGLVSTAGNAFVNNLGNANIATQRYRLVSCLVKITVTNTVLNMGGKMYCCATYDPLSIKYFSAVAQNDTLIDRFGDFSLIRNGLWNTTMNVNETNCIEALWVPTDHVDTFFQRQFAYYGTAYTANDTLMTPATDGAHIGYVFALAGLPATSNFIVEQWANYEVIPDPTTAPYLGTSIDSTWTTKDRDSVFDTVQTVMKKEGFIRKPQEQEGSWGNILKSVVTTGLPYLLKLLA
jgi:hypothetical protein